MIRLGVVSDSHDSSFWLERYLELCKSEKYDAVYHLGDMVLNGRWLARRLEMPVTVVAGNCDAYGDCPREARAEWEGHRLLALHGDRFGVKTGLTRLSYYAEEAGADVVLFGHTHIATAEYVGRCLMINPGALMKGCYAEVTIDGPRVVPLLKHL